MPGSLGTRIPTARTLTAALVSSALLVSACGSLPFMSPTPTPAPVGQAGAAQSQGAGQRQRPGGGQGAGQGQRPGDGQGRQGAGFRGQGQGQGGPQAAGTPNPQSPLVTGEVDIVDGRTVTVATNTGWRKVDVPDSATILTEGRGTSADLVAGTLVAVTSKQDGTAQIVRLFPQGANPRIGQFPMQGANAGNLMTNAKIDSFDGSKLNLDYNGEKATINVPADAQIIKPTPGAFTDIVVGARVQMNGTVNGDTLTARSVTIYGNAAANNASGNTAGGRPAGATAGGRQGRNAAAAAGATNP
jgi:hypothetical protein